MGAARAFWRLLLAPGTIKVPAVRYKGDKFKGQDTFTTIVAELPDGRKVRHYLDTGTEEFFTLPKRESVPEIGPAGFPAEALEA